ncbi:unnamed protein product, partial [Sphacelaria rigidula]
IESVELALNGQGVYLGITDKDKLMGQLEALQTKEAQLQKKELLLLSVENASALMPGLAVTNSQIPLQQMATQPQHYLPQQPQPQPQSQQQQQHQPSQQLTGTSTPQPPVLSSAPGSGSVPGHDMVNFPTNGMANIPGNNME